LFLIPFWSAWSLRKASHSFLSLFLAAFGVGMFFNIFDLLVIDYLICCAWTPKFLILPGTEGMTGYKDYRHHFRGFIVGTILSVIVSLLIAVVLIVIN
ncbi:MAG TPA: nitroreductase, partial [Acidobacteriota bacterium]|nr:nitroreductase [Acidobacteriota bacterium]